MVMLKLWFSVQLDDGRNKSLSSLQREPRDVSRPALYCIVYRQEGHVVVFCQVITYLGTFDQTPIKKMEYHVPTRNVHP